MDNLLLQNAGSDFAFHTFISKIGNNDTIG